ncbi:MAG: hypothetical protein M1492_09880 [Gammaproteobacteria bacterium]|nr:hypothetical protein [Gammaproteobacteria bacterium]
MLKHENKYVLSMADYGKDSRTLVVTLAMGNGEDIPPEIGMRGFYLAASPAGILLRMALTRLEVHPFARAFYVSWYEKHRRLPDLQEFLSRFFPAWPREHGFKIPALPFQEPERPAVLKFIFHRKWGWYPTPEEELHRVLDYVLAVADFLEQYEGPDTTEMVEQFGEWVVQKSGLFRHYRFQGWPAYHLDYPCVGLRKETVAELAPVGMGRELVAVERIEARDLPEFLRVNVKLATYYPMEFSRALFAFWADGKLEPTRQRLTGTVGVRTLQRQIRREGKAPEDTPGLSLFCGMDHVESEMWQGVNEFGFGFYQSPGASATETQKVRCENFAKAAAIFCIRSFWEDHLPVAAEFEPWLREHQEYFPALPL